MNRYQRLAGLSMRLASLGITDLKDQDQLRRIEMTLSRWSENECGNENGGAIERDEATGKPYWTYETGSGKRGRYAIADKETGALNRLRKIMAKYPKLWYYHQGDPRGCALYIGRNKDLTSEQIKQIDSYYTRGVAVCI